MSPDVLQNAKRVCPRCGREGPSKYCLEDGVQLVPVTDKVLGRVLGDKYRLLSVIGRGGMGTVYEAFHLQLETRVALKVMNESLSGDKLEVCRRFQREGRIINSLIHPNIVRALDLGFYDDCPYLVMDYIEGERLDQAICWNGRLKTVRAISICLQICDALSYAHQSGVLHRDLKPANIMLVKGDDGQDLVRVLDFGLAKLVGHDSQGMDKLTETGAFIGTPSYMSPEQCLGKISEIDERSDIYALGCLMYEMLTGAAAIEGCHALQILHGQIKQTPKHFAEIGICNLDAELEALVFRALEKSPDDRPSSMSELRGDLAKISARLETGFAGVGSRRKLLPNFLPTRSQIAAASVIGVLGCLASFGYAESLFAKPESKPNVSHAGASTKTVVHKALLRPSPLASVAEAGSDVKRKAPPNRIKNMPIHSKSLALVAESETPAPTVVKPLIKRPLELSADQTERVRDLEYQAQGFYEHGKRANGDALIKQAIEIRKTADISPAFVDDEMALCKSAFVKRDDSVMQESCAEAESVLRAADVSDSDQRYAQLKSYRGWIMVIQKRWTEAEALLNSALAQHRGRGAESVDCLVDDLRGLRLAHLGEGKFEQVLINGQEALSVVASGSNEEGQIHQDLARAKMEMKDLAGGAQEIEAACKIYSDLNAHASYARSLQILGTIKSRQHHFDEAIKAYQEEADVWEQVNNKVNHVEASKLVEQTQLLASQSGN